MTELLTHGGPVLWAQLILAFIALVLVLERLIFFQIVRTQVTQLLQGMHLHLKTKNFAEAAYQVSQEPGPAARVAHSVVMRHETPRADLVSIAEEAVRLEVPSLEKNLRMLVAMATFGPLLGLLGTALGLLDIFSKIASLGGTIAQAQVAEGLYQSLLTTMVGLSLGAAAYLASLLLQGRARRALNELERTAFETVNLVTDAREESDVVPLPSALNQSRNEQPRMESPKERA